LCKSSKSKPSNQPPAPGFPGKGNAMIENVTVKLSLAEARLVLNAIGCFGGSGDRVIREAARKISYQLRWADDHNSGDWKAAEDKQCHQ
jgi:hypothetical protein